MSQYYYFCLVVAKKLTSDLERMKFHFMMVIYTLWIPQIVFFLILLLFKNFFLTTTFHGCSYLLDSRCKLFIDAIFISRIIDQITLWLTIRTFSGRWQMLYFRERQLSRFNVYWLRILVFLLSFGSLFCILSLFVFYCTKAKSILQTC